MNNETRDLIIIVGAVIVLALFLIAMIVTCIQAQVFINMEKENEKAVEEMTNDEKNILESILATRGIDKDEIYGYNVIKLNGNFKDDVKSMYTVELYYADGETAMHDQWIVEVRTNGTIVKKCLFRGEL